MPKNKLTSWLTKLNSTQVRYNSKAFEEVWLAGQSFHALIANNSIVTNDFILDILTSSVALKSKQAFIANFADLERLFRLARNLTNDLKAYSSARTGLTAVCSQILTLLEKEQLGNSEYYDDVRFIVKQHNLKCRLFMPEVIPSAIPYQNCIGSFKLESTLNITIFAAGKSHKENKPRDPKPNLAVNENSTSDLTGSQKGKRKYESIVIVDDEETNSNKRRILETVTNRESLPNKTIDSSLSSEINSFFTEPVSINSTHLENIIDNPYGYSGDILNGYVNNPISIGDASQYSQTELLNFLGTFPSYREVNPLEQTPDDDLDLVSIFKNML